MVIGHIVFALGLQPVSVVSVTVRTMAGSRRHAGTVLGGRRRGKRPRSPEDRRTMDDGVASGHGRRRKGGRWTTAWQAATVGEGDRNDKSDGVAGHSRPRTDKSVKCQKGLRQTVAEVTTHSNGCAKDGNKVLRTETSVSFNSRGASQRYQDLSSMLRTGQEKRNKAALCPRYCARQAHAAVPRACSNDRA